MTGTALIVATIAWLVIGIIIGIALASWLALHVIAGVKEVMHRRAASIMADLIAANDRATQAEWSNRVNKEAAYASAWLAAWRGAPPDGESLGAPATKREARILFHIERAAYRAQRAAEPEPEPVLTCDIEDCPTCRAAREDEE